MGTVRLALPERKELRTVAVVNYMHRAGWEKVVCFTSGNAGAALRQAFGDVVTVGPNEPLQTDTWWRMSDIRKVWPDRFDATPGHLPLQAMNAIAARLRDHLGALDPRDTYVVPSGSGETITCLQIAYPGLRLVPEFGRADEPGPLQFERRAPLMGLVAALGARG